MISFRISVLFSILFFAASTLAAEKRPTLKAISSLQYRNNLGFRKSMSLRVDGGLVFVNGKKLNPVEVSLSARPLSNLLRTQQDSITPSCAAGVFVHEVKLRGKKSTERGCMESSRFTELLTSQKALEKKYVY